MGPFPSSVKRNKKFYILQEFLRYSYYSHDILSFPDFKINETENIVMAPWDSHREPTAPCGRRRMEMLALGQPDGHPHTPPGRPPGDFSREDFLPSPGVVPASSGPGDSPFSGGLLKCAQGQECV